jgi:hypothetical protein
MAEVGGSRTGLWALVVVCRMSMMVVGAHELMDGRSSPSVEGGGGLSRTRGWALTNWWVGAALAGPRVVVGPCRRSVMVVVVVVAEVAGLEVVVVVVV